MRGLGGEGASGKEGGGARRCLHFVRASQPVGFPPYLPPYLPLPFLGSGAADTEKTPWEKSLLGFSRLSTLIRESLHLRLDPEISISFFFLSVSYSPFPSL